MYGLCQQNDNKYAHLHWNLYTTLSLPLALILSLHPSLFLSLSLSSLSVLLNGKTDIFITSAFLFFSVAVTLALQPWVSWRVWKTWWCLVEFWRWPLHQQHPPSARGICLWESSPYLELGTAPPVGAETLGVVSFELLVGLFSESDKEVHSNQFSENSQKVRKKHLNIAWLPSSGFKFFLLFSTRQNKLGFFSFYLLNFLFIIVTVTFVCLFAWQRGLLKKM